MATTEASALRRRAASSSSAPEAEKKGNVADATEEKPQRLTAGAPEGVSWGTAFVLLLLVRHFSAKSNLIHDCDEVFNYWEPLHYLLYKSGFQTWEYSSEFALRSYLYLLFHGFLAFPATWWYGEGPQKVQVFYMLRLVLGIFSAGSEAAMVTALSRRYGKRLAAYTLMLLCFTSGCFNASTSFLPSTFSMYCMTLGVASLLSQKPNWAVVAITVGVLLGWPFAVLAFLPLIVYAVILGGFVRPILVGFMTSACMLTLSILCDRVYYGQWTMSILNLISYNVSGGGGSALYGVESPSFYLRNGFNNFNFALLFALVLPLVVLVARKKAYWSLLALVSPLYVWLSFMSLQAHKEERFLYPVYTLMCVSAAAAIESLPELLPKKLGDEDDSNMFLALKYLRPVILGSILVLSYSRTTSLLNGYSAPLKVLGHLPSVIHGDLAHQDAVLCIGSEWHRYPSSFFLPSTKYKVKWIDDGFRGLLPFPFDSSIGGSAAAPPYFNKLNQASPDQFTKNEDACTFLVELDLNRDEVKLRGHNRTHWEVVVEFRFLDNEKSPALHRAFFIPWAWQSSNIFGSYRLLRSRRISNESEAR